VVDPAHRSVQQKVADYCSSKPAYQATVMSQKLTALRNYIDTSSAWYQPDSQNSQGFRVHSFLCLCCFLCWQQNAKGVKRYGDKQIELKRSIASGAGGNGLHDWCLPVYIRGRIGAPARQVGNSDSLMQLPPGTLRKAEAWCSGQVKMHGSESGTTGLCYASLKGATTDRQPQKCTGNTIVPGGSQREAPIWSTLTGLKCTLPTNASIRMPHSGALQTYGIDLHESQPLTETCVAKWTATHSRGRHAPGSRNGHATTLAVAKSTHTAVQGLAGRKVPR
jgi:hypothetical protein